MPDHELDHPARRRGACALRVPRYFFSNKSDDIRKLFTDALDRVGVEWTTAARGCDPFSISVARRASVALMDANVGPKY